MAEKIRSVRRAGAEQATSLVVLLHGYGANADDLIGLAEPLAISGAAFVSPDAPWWCAASPAGRLWFPIPEIDGSRQDQSESGFVAAIETLQAMLEDEMDRYGLGMERVVLGGFSQGCMLALHMGMRQSTAPAGVLGFSGRLIAPERLSREIRCRPPVLLTHGEVDSMVPVGCLFEAVSVIAAEQVSVRWQVSLGTGHGIAPESVALGRESLRAWLKFEQTE